MSTKFNVEILFDLTFSYIYIYIKSLKCDYFNFFFMYIGTNTVWWWHSTALSISLTHSLYIGFCLFDGSITLCFTCLCYCYSYSTFSNGTVFVWGSSSSSFLSFFLLSSSIIQRVYNYPWSFICSFDGVVLFISIFVFFFFCFVYVCVQGGVWSHPLS